MIWTVTASSDIVVANSDARNSVFLNRTATTAQSSLKSMTKHSVDWSNEFGHAAEPGRPRQHARLEFVSWQPCHGVLQTDFPFAPHGTRTRLPVMLPEFCGQPESQGWATQAR